MSLWASARDGRQDDQAGMKFDVCSELAKIVRILGHDDPIFLDGPRKHNLIGLL
jgi:hypothetical protein